MHTQAPPTASQHGQDNLRAAPAGHLRPASCWAFSLLRHTGKERGTEVHALKEAAFQPGDRVVLPPYGIGVICGTCSKPVGRETHIYYQVEFENSSSRAFVPVQAPGGTGMRAALTPPDLPRLLGALQTAELELPRQWSARHQKVTAVLASGDPLELAALIGQFHRWNIRRALPDLDRQAFRKAVKLLEQEIRYLTGQTASTICLFLERALLEPDTVN